MRRDRWRTLPPHRLNKLYVRILPDLRDAAWDLGWCLATHGSARRDFDLFGVPWIENAAPAEQLVHAIASATTRRGITASPALAVGGGLHVTEKPHGRRAFVIHILLRGSFGTHAYIDLSVMPRATAVEQLP